jgi:hypothetical protein
MGALDGIFRFYLAETKREKTAAKKVPGVQMGLMGRTMGVLDCSALMRALPAKRGTREGGFRDAIEAMALALLAEGVSLEKINAAAEATLDGYTNSL